MAVLGTTVAVACDKTLRLFDASTGAAGATIPLPAKPLNYGVTAAGDTIYIACADGSVIAVR